MYSRVMVAIDGSSIAMRALGEAVRMAKGQGAGLVLTYVIEYPHIYVQDRGYDPAPVTEALLDDARRVLAQAQSFARDEHIASHSLLIDDRNCTDSVAAQLQKAADQCKVDLVVLGTHGRGGFKRLLLGSVAEAFVRASRRPVLLVPGRPEAKVERAQTATRQ